MLPSWIFRRGGAYLLLHCRESWRGITLVVSGDGDLRSYSFRDFEALLSFEAHMEEFLVETGWSHERIPGLPAMPERAAAHVANREDADSQTHPPLQ